MPPKNRGRKAWLVTWEWSGDHAKRNPEVVAVFRPQLTFKRVSELVEHLYSFSKYTPQERMIFALGLQPSPYPARVEATGQIICGHNPWLRARLVDDLVFADSHHVTWAERKWPTRSIGVNPLLIL